MTTLLSALVEILLVALVIFTPFAFGSVETWAFTTIEIISGVLFLVWLVRLFVERDWKAVRAPWVLAPAAVIIAFVLFQLVPLPRETIRELSPATYKLYASNIKGYDANYYIQNLDQKDYRFSWLQYKPYKAFLWRPVKNGERPLSIFPPSTIEYLLKLLALCAVFLVTVNMLTEKEQMRRLVIAIICAGFFLAFIGILQKLTWNGRLLWFRTPRYGGDPFGPYVNKNHFANYLAMIIPVTVGYIFSSVVHQFRRVQGDTFGLRLKNLMVSDFIYKIVMQIFVVAVMITALIMSHSLLGIVSLIYGLLFIVAYMFIKSKKALMGIVLVLIVFIPILISSSGSAIYLQDMFEKFIQMSESERQRINFFVDGLKIVNDYPVTGTGLGTFWRIFPKYQATAKEFLIRFAHNDYLQLFTEVGIIAAAIVIVSAVVFVLMQIFPLLFNREKRSFFFLMFGVNVGIIVMLMHSIGEFNFHIPANALLFVILCALIYNMNRQRKDQALRTIKKYMRVHSR